MRHLAAAMTALLVMHSLIAYSVFYSLIAYPILYSLINCPVFGTLVTILLVCYIRVTAVHLVESWLAQSSSDDCG